MTKTHRAAIALAMSWAIASSASADVLLISGGARGGSYERWANNLSRLLMGLGHASKVLPSGGALDNVTKVKGAEAHVGFAQADTLMSEGAEGVEILGAVSKGCVFVAVAKDGKVGDEDDLQDEGHTIAVGAKGSGSQSTWAYMTKLEPGYANSAADYTGGIRALGKLKTGGLDAVLWVTDPGNATHKMLVAVGNDDELEFIDIDDGDLNDKLPDGSAVYTFEEVDTPGWGDTDTICTTELVVASPALPEATLEDLAAQVISNRAALVK